MADEPADEALAHVLRERGKSNCPGCGRAIDRGDVSWNNASTSEGTPYTAALIQCQGCDAEIAHWDSWCPGADDFDEFVENVLPDWEVDDG